MSTITVDSVSKKNGKKSWRYRFSVAAIGGKRKWFSKAGFETKADAFNAAKEALYAYQNGGTETKSSRSDWSVHDYFNSWLDDISFDIMESTVYLYKKYVNNHILPYIGKYMMKSITREHLQDIINDMFNNGYAINTLIELKAILTKAFNHAYDNHYIPSNPSVRLKIPRNKRPKKKTRSEPHVYIPNDKIKEIFELFPEIHRYHLPLMIGYKCGLRLGEVFGLCWEDVDFENKKLRINRQVQWHVDRERSDNDKIKNNGRSTCTGYWFFTKPKYYSFRIIDIDDELVELLRRELSRQEVSRSYYEEFYTYYYAEDKLTFSGKKPEQPIPPENRISQGEGDVKINLMMRRENGEFLNPRSMQHASIVIHKRLQYPEFDFHSLRHTHATMLAEANLPIKYVQNRLGHSKVEITMNVYQHLTDTISEKGTNMLNDMFKNEMSST